MKNKFVYWIGIFTLMTILSACAEPVMETETPETPQEETQPQTEVDEIIMYIDSERVDCEGAGPQKCMRVRYTEDGDWEYFYSGIDGFHYVPGFVYQLRVCQIPVENPPADGSSIAWQLLEVINREPIVSETASLENTDWELVAFGEEDMVYYQGGITLRLEEGKLGGNASCNTYFAGYEIDGQTLQVGMPGSTKMMCEETLMDQEMAFFRALDSLSNFEINGNMLEITYAAGRLTFRAVE